MDEHEIGERYVRLALQIDQHFEGFVDGYYGPAELREQAVSGGARDLAALAADADALLEAISMADFGLRRYEFLSKQTVAMHTAVRKLQGQELALVEEAQLFFDITPERVPETTFDAALAEIDRLLPGGGPLIDRMAAWERRLDLTAERLPTLVEIVEPEITRRARALFDLPPGESVEIGLVNDKPWSGYNWYLGDYRSRVEINTDLPTPAYRLPDLLAHETYPGHHAEHAIKEYKLYRQAGRLEHSILLLSAPECVISEGIARVALDMIMSKAEQAAFLKDTFFPACGPGDVDVDHVLAVVEAMEGLLGVRRNAVFLLHVDGRPEAEVMQYIQHYGLRTERQARQALRFIGNPLYRAYQFTYIYGEQLVREFIGRDDPVSAFSRLLSEPLVPSDLRIVP